MAVKIKGDATLEQELTLENYSPTRDDGPTSKALYVDINNILQYGDVILPVFGTDFTFVEEPNNQTNSTTSPLTVATLSAAPVTGGTYRVACDYKWNHDSAGTDAIFELKLDGALMGREMRQEPKDSAGAGLGGSDQSHSASFLYYITLPAGATPVVTLDMTSGNSGTASAVDDITIEFWRVA